jgi:hypothetical protein
MIRMPLLGLVFSLVWPQIAEAGVGLAIAGGAQLDTPRVWDGRSFSSEGSVEPVAGVALRWPPHGSWGAELEGAYARRSFASDAFVTDTPVRADFIEWSLLGVWRERGSQGRWAVSALLGPQLGARLRARRRFRDVDQDVTNELRETDLKALAALRLSRSKGPLEVYLEGRLAWGLTNLDDTNQQRIHARSVGLRLGLAR